VVPNTEPHPFSSEIHSVKQQAFLKQKGNTNKNRRILCLGEIQMMSFSLMIMKSPTDFTAENGTRTIFFSSSLRLSVEMCSVG